MPGHFPGHSAQFSDFFRNVSGLRDKVGHNVFIKFRYLTHVWGFVVVAPGQIFSCESGLWDSRECIQSVSAYREDVGRDHSDTRGGEPPSNRCAWRTAAAKAGFYRPIQALLKCFNIVVIVCEPYVGNPLRVPEYPF